MLRWKISLDLGTIKTIYHWMGNSHQTPSCKSILSNFLHEIDTVTAFLPFTIETRIFISLGFRVLPVE